MSISSIVVHNLNKTFKVFDRRPGIIGTAKDLFSRTYKEFEAVKDVSFEIAPGEMVGYIGANGAGKSTTIKMLTGILHPSSGDVRVAGMSPFTNRYEYLRNIGVVFGQRSQLWWDLAVQESFALLKRIYQVSESDYTQRMKRFDDLMQIGELLQKPVRKLSLGQKMRCEVAAALLHHPSVVFLDEPTIGLDVVAKRAIRSLLAEINRELGTTVILTTHDLQDIETLCERVMILDEGKILFDNSLDQLRNEMGGGVRLSFYIHGDSLPELPQSLNKLPVRWEREETCLVAHFKSQSISRAELIREVLGCVEVDDIQFEEEHIEDIVGQIYRGNT